MKLHGKERSCGSHLGIELGPSCSEGRALTEKVLVLDPWCKAHKKSCTSCFVIFITVELRFNEPLYNKVLGIKNDFHQPGQNYSKMYGTETRFNEIIVRESSFNMTRVGDEDIETRSLKF